MATQVPITRTGREAAQIWGVIGLAPAMGVRTGGQVCCKYTRYNTVPDSQPQPQPQAIAQAQAQLHSHSPVAAAAGYGCGCGWVRYFAPLGIELEKRDFRRLGT